MMRTLGFLALAAILTGLTSTGVARAAPQPNGAACSQPTDCASYYCVSGTCCATACDSIAGSTCIGGNFRNAASCSSGSCIEGTPISCGAYACGATTCRTSCSNSGDCAPGFSCTAGQCVLQRATCSADRRYGITGDGRTYDCAPYACFDGVCAATCARPSDCLQGNVCDDQRRCIDPNAPPPSGDQAQDCSVHDVGVGGSDLVVLAAVAAAAVWTRRKR